MSDAMLLGIGSVSTGGLVAWLTRPILDFLRRVGEQDDPALRKELESVGMDPARLPEYLLIWRGLALAALLVVSFGLRMPPVAVLLAFVLYRMGPIWVRRMVSRVGRRTTEQVAGVARSLSGQVRVGLPLSEALASVSAETPAPLGAHLRRVARQIAQGTEPRIALDGLRQRVRVHAVAAMCVALQVANERGGRLAEVLDRISHSAEELVRVERKRETDTAAGRLMVLLMSLFPVGFLAFLVVLDPGLLAATTEQTLGQIVLAVVGLMVFLSTRWAARILARVE